MMLELLGHTDAAGAIVKAIKNVLVEGPRTRDMGGTPALLKWDKRLRMQFDCMERRLPTNLGILARELNASDIK